MYSMKEVIYLPNKLNEEGTKLGMFSRQEGCLYVMIFKKKFVNLISFTLGDKSVDYPDWVSPLSQYILIGC